MAESAARFLASPQGKDRHLLVVAGGNHISHGFGIPRRVFRRIPTSYQLIGGNEVVISAEKQKELMDVTPPDYPMVPYDFLNFFAYEELPKTGVLLGVAFEPALDGRGLTVNTVVPASNAERSGVKPGDRLLALDGEDLKDSFDLVYALKQKHIGDRSTLTVERLGKQLKLEVLYEKTSDPHEHGKP
jgi:predicted metalloprotease with PDZ domain